MTYKSIVYSDHASARLSQHRFSRRDIRDLLARGERRRERTKPGGEQRWSCRGLLDQSEVLVVFVEDAHRIEIITLYELD